MSDAQDFIPEPYTESVQKGAFKWSAPSNIALVKYWGKTEPQLPANPSVSLTLQNCRTITEVAFERKSSKSFSFEFLFEGQPKPSFEPKIEKFFTRIGPYSPFLKDFHFKISSENTFPHSSGIASSASGMAALSVNLMSLERLLNPEMTNKYFFEKASFLARLGSGSACRSIKGNPVVWGKHADIPGSSDGYGVEIPFVVHPVFKTYQDTILLVDRGQKTVSSTVGHDLMHGHPFGEQRFLQARQNLSEMARVLQSGNLEKFVEITESEALTLHALMMSSRPYFLLMKPNTLAIITKIWEFRNSSGIPLCFTLDAGANVHVLYPENVSSAVLEFIKKELVVYCQNGQYICDECGNGAQELTI